jgi:hypothetical protein
MQSVTPASYDGEVLELAFPPGQSFGVEKVEQREDKLREVLQALFGIAPKLRCVIRQPAAGGVTVIEDDEPAPDEDAALERLKTELNAEVASDGDL